MALITTDMESSHAALTAAAAAYRGDSDLQQQHEVHDASDSEHVWEDDSISQPPPVGTAPFRRLDDLQHIAAIYDCSRALVTFATDQCSRSGSEHMLFTWLDQVTSSHRPEVPFVSECASLEAIRRFFVLHDLFDRRKRHIEDGIHMIIELGWLAIQAISRIRTLSLEHRRLSSMWLQSKFHEPLATFVIETNLIPLAKYLWIVDAGSAETEVENIFRQATAPTELARRGLPLDTVGARVPPEGPVFDLYVNAIRCRWNAFHFAAALDAPATSTSHPAATPMSGAADAWRELEQRFVDARHVRDWRRGHVLLDDNLFLAFFRDRRDARRRGGELVASAWAEARESLVGGPLPTQAAVRPREPRRAVPLLYTNNDGSLQHLREAPSATPRAIRSMHRDPSESLSSMLCLSFNSQRGCAHKQRDCPDGLLHRCDNQRPDGSICGAWQHNRIRCVERDILRTEAFGRRPRVTGGQSDVHILPRPP